MARLRFLALATVFALAALALSGCGTPSYGYIAGTVSLGRGGPAIDGITVIAGSAMTTTDSNGAFRLKVPPQVVDVIVTGRDLAKAKVQGVSVRRGRTTRVELVVQEEQVPGSTAGPPTVSLDLTPGRVYSGTVNYTISFTSTLPLQRIDIRYGHRDLLPDVSYAYSAPGPQPVQIEWDTARVFRYSTGDDGLLSGETYVSVALYDINYNSTELVVPVKLDNRSTQSLTQPVTDLTAEAVTLGQNLMLMSATPLGAPTDATLFVNLEWTETSEWQAIQNYRVYRAFAAGGPWEMIAEVPANGSSGWHTYLDASTRLAVGQDAYYRVSAHNALGEGPTSYVVRTRPLPRFTVDLTSPADGAFGTSPTPGFAWRVSGPYKPGGLVAGALFSYRLTVSGAHDPLETWSWSGSTAFPNGLMPVEATQGDYGVVYGGPALQPAKLYYWDITEARVKQIVSYGTGGEEIGWAVAYSGWPPAGSLLGGSSVNGAFSFTVQPQ